MRIRCWDGRLSMMVGAPGRTDCLWEGDKVKRGVDVKAGRPKGGYLFTGILRWLLRGNGRSYVDVIK
jgi:hypothetical protein